jgi:hypothetical protein
VARRRYSDDERANALAALAANGGNVERTARQIGVPHKTLDNWSKGACHPAVAELGNRKKGSLSDAFEDVAWKLLGVAGTKADKLNAKDAVIAAATAVDKMRLLRDEPTGITDDRARRPDERAAIIVAVFDQIRTRGAGGNGGPRLAGVVGGVAPAPADGRGLDAG